MKSRVAKVDSGHFHAFHSQVNSERKQQFRHQINLQPESDQWPPETDLQSQNELKLFSEKTTKFLRQLQRGFQQKSTNPFMPST
jgi:hypothetical protein